VAAAVTATFVLTAAQPDPLLVAASVLLVLVGFAPLYFWLVGSSRGLPIWPAFSLYSAAISALPVVQGARSLVSYSSGAIFGGLATMAGFLALGTMVWLAMTAREPRPPKLLFMLEPGSAVRSLFWCLGVGLAFQANSVAGWVTFPGNSMQVVRGITGGLSYLGIFALSYFTGAGLLSRAHMWLFGVMMAALFFLSITGILLAGAVPIVALAAIGYALGARKVPWLLLTTLLPVITILHAGKYQMREQYYGEDGAAKHSNSRFTSLPAFYSEWMSYGLEELGGFSGAFNASAREESARSSIFERAGNLHMLLLVTEKTPDEVPYLNGLTYEIIPQMLLPRFLSPNKALSHAGNVMLSMNYGLVDADGARNVSIGWSLVAEAYANFGYLGVVALAIMLSAMYAEVSRLSSGVPITSLRFIAGLIVLAGVTNENSLGVFITMQFQGVVGAALASVFLMRRQSNPFADQTGASEIRLTAARNMSKNLKTMPSTVGPAKWGGDMPPKWAPLSHRKAYELAAARRKAEAASLADEESKDVKQKAERPRQVAVPIQPYYYRSRKA